MDAKTFCNRFNVRAVSEWSDENPNMPEWRDANHFKVTLHRNTPRRRMTVYFSQGYGINGEPTPESVVECLTSDASSILNSGFEDWAADLGLDTDSRKAESLYRVTEKLSAKFAAFVGEEMPDLLRGDES